MAKRAVDSTLKRILNYTAEIIISIILLIIICLPLLFAVPMWLQHILLGVPRANLFIDPISLFGLDGAFWVTSLLGLVSLAVGFLFVSRGESGFAEARGERETESDDEEEEPLSDTEDVDETAVAEDEELDLEEIDEEEEEEEEEEVD